VIVVEFDDGSREPEVIEFSQRRAPRSHWETWLAILAGLAVLGLLIYLRIAQGVAALVMFPGVPIVLLWFIYWFFLRRLIRIRRIRGIRERKLLREAAQRDRTL